MSINKSALLAALQPKRNTVEIEGFGPLQVRQLSVGEVGAVRASLKEGDAPEVFGLKLVITSFVDEGGAPVFDDSDLDQLTHSSHTAVEKLVQSALEVNGFTKAASAKN